MEEVEIKILDVDPIRLVKKLTALGATKVSDGILDATFYDFPDRSVKRKRDVVRLRTEGDVAILTFKKFRPSVRAKVRDEFEVQVSSLQDAKKILEGLGLSAVKHTRKKRTRYALGRVHFEIDQYLDDKNFIPPFLEIEGPTIKTIEKYAALLGFSKKDLRPWSLADLEKHYRQR